MMFTTSSQLQGLPEAISEWSVFLLSAGCNVSILEEAVTQHLTTVRREVCLGFRFHQHDGEGLMGIVAEIMVARDCAGGPWPVGAPGSPELKSPSSPAIFSPTP